MQIYPPLKKKKNVVKRKNSNLFSFMYFLSLFLFVYLNSILFFYFYFFYLGNSILLILGFVDNILDGHN